MTFNNSYRKPAVIVIASGVVIGLLGWLLSGGDDSQASVPTFEVQQGDLQINVLQGGEIRALRNDEIKSEIESSTKIISLIPEGYLVTEKDVADRKTLVELDNSELKTRIQDHEIDFQGTVAGYIEADEAREIQRSENLSLTREVRQIALFALMDFEKYFGKTTSATILQKVHLPETADTFDSFAAQLEAEGLALNSGQALDSGRGKVAESAASLLLDDSTAVERLDYGSVLGGETMSEGEAQQALRQLEDELLLHKAELAVAKQKVEASERLADKKFVSKAQLENDQVNYEKVLLSVKTAETQLELFRKYEFPRQCEQLLCDYREALNKLRRTVRSNRSKMAQVESRFLTAKRRYDMELAKKEDLERQLEACNIVSTTPGLVAYGDLNASASSRYSENIEEGATIRLRQTILTIPDMARMGVSVNVHESQVKKVRIGQRALVQVDAEPGKILEGKVAELAVLPDSNSSRYTPTLKVYPCTIHVEGSHSWLKPGMNAKVEIIIEQLSDVVYVPVQSIEVENDLHYCYVSSGGELERREIDTGSFNDDFIEVREGLKAGDQVALSFPKRTVSETAARPVASLQSKPSKDSSSPAVASR